MNTAPDLQASSRFYRVDSIGSSERFELAARQQNIRLDCDIDPAIASVYADRDRLFQVIGNLLANAIKFTPQGGRVSLRARLRADDAEISVQDSGPGIPAQNLPHVFDRFWRGDRASRTARDWGWRSAKASLRPTMEASG